MGSRVGSQFSKKQRSTCSKADSYLNIFKKIQPPTALTREDAALLPTSKDVATQQEPENPTCNCPDPDTHLPTEISTESDTGGAQQQQQHSRSSLAEQNIEFENAVQNAVFVRRIAVDEHIPPGQEIIERKRRSIERILDGTGTMTDQALVFPSTIALDQKTKPPEENIVGSDGYFTRFTKIVDVTETTFVIENLRHFTPYQITVNACRSGPGKNKCGPDRVVQARTLKLPAADRITGLQVVGVSGVNYTADSVQLQWPTPQLVNGMVVSYTIRYQRMNLENSQYTDLCLSHTNVQNNTAQFLLKHLENGNYSFTVMAISLAGASKFSEPVYYYVNVSIRGVGGQSIN